MWTSLNITQILHKYSCFDYFRESRPTERLAVFRSGARPKQLPRRGRDGGARARLGILDSFKKKHSKIILIFFKKILFVLVKGPSHPRVWETEFVSSVLSANALFGGGWRWRP